MTHFFKIVHGIGVVWLTAVHFSEDSPYELFSIRCFNRANDLLVERLETRSRVRGKEHKLHIRELEAWVARCIVQEDDDISLLLLHFLVEQLHPLLEET